MVKRGWEHFDNSGIMCLRLLNKLHVNNVVLAGFDGFANGYSDSYADEDLPHINPGKKWEEDMLRDFRNTTEGSMKLTFITESKYAQ